MPIVRRVVRQRCGTDVEFGHDIGSAAQNVCFVAQRGAGGAGGDVLNLHGELADGQPVGAPGAAAAAVHDGGGVIFTNAASTIPRASTATAVTVACCFTIVSF